MSTSLGVSGWKCTEDSLCGNGVRDGDEICDDSDKFDIQGCEIDCLGIISGFTCQNGTATHQDDCFNCGDFIE